MDWPLDEPVLLPFVSNIPEWFTRTRIHPDKTSRAWRAANDAVFTPIWVPGPMTVKQLYCWNGATVSGNLDLGLYAAEPIDPTSPYAAVALPTTRLISSGSVAQAGINTVQEIDVTDTPVARGLYYLAMAMDNATGTVMKLAGVTGVSPKAWHYALGGFRGQPTAFPLPATAATVEFISGIFTGWPAPLMAAGGVA